MVISLVAIAIAFASFYTTTRLQRLQGSDYVAKLQIVDESISISGQGFSKNDAFSYEANLGNRGVKPVRIDSVYLDYGSMDSQNKRYKHQVEGEFYIGPDEKRKASFRLSKKNFREALQKFKIDQCYFYLRVRFYTPTGTIVEKTRPLMGLGERSTTFFVHEGEILYEQKRAEGMQSPITQGNTTDVERFLLASGFALLVVLVGWANQISSKNKETKDLEADFLRKANLKGDDYKKIVNERGATEESFNALVEFLYTKNEEDLDIFDKIRHIKEDIPKLRDYYGRRFWLLLWMSISLFITGTISFILPLNEKFWAIIPNLIFVAFLFFNLMKVHELEKRYTKNLSDAMEKL